jgi:hypothetical protein
MNAATETVDEPGPDEGGATSVLPLRKLAERVVAGVESAPIGPTTQDPNAALKDLRIPAELLERLFSQTAERGLKVDSVEVKDPYNGDIVRSITVVRGKDGTQPVYLAQVAGFVLDDPSPANLSAVDYLSRMFQSGTVIDVLSPDLPSGPHKAFRKIWAAWARDKNITVVPIPARDIEDLGKTDFSAEEVIDTLNLEQLLTPTPLPTAPAGTITRGALRVFFSYAHEDHDFREQLETHLSLLAQQKLIDTWSDRDITAGANWEDEIDEKLEAADIILLLVSADFLASDYVNGRELKRALERHEAAEARVVPIIIRPVDWEEAPFARLQAVPDEGKAVTTWGNTDEAWQDVVKSIRKLITDVLGKT